MCCTRLAANTGHKKSPSGHHRTTSSAISSQLRHVSTIGKKLVKQQYLLHMSAQYGELRPTSGWDRSGSLGHPCKFQRVSRLGSLTARTLVGGVNQTAALNRERHLYSAGRPQVGYWPTFLADADATRLTPKKQHKTTEINANSELVQRQLVIDAHGQSSLH